MKKKRLLLLGQKVGCSEWKRAFRWMVGVNNWSTDNLRLHLMGKNGLERLTNRGAEETLWALQSDRYIR